MNILFLTLLDFESLHERNIYSDLLREFVKNGHAVYVISPTEKRNGKETHFILEDNATILRLRIGNTQKTNLIEKGISTIMIGPLFKVAIMKYYSEVKFDLVLYSTPPITFTGAVEYVKKRDCAKTYLLLKDIFPQNAVDMGMMSRTGVKSILYKYFRKKEKRLYSVSDYIGCMSQANKDYIINHNPEVDPEIVEVCPNSVEPVDISVDEKTRVSIREKYGIPIDKKVFVYGGNLGKPQGIPFLIECLKACAEANNSFFLIVGSGTEYGKLEEYEKSTGNKNFKLMKSLPKKDYDNIVGACDVGLIFLDKRFTIPNFPSRLLVYMQAKLPVLACTDSKTDIGKVIVEGGFGWWCESTEPSEFVQIVNKIITNENPDYSQNSWNMLNREYTAEKSFRIIVSQIVFN